MVSITPTSRVWVEALSALTSSSQASDYLPLAMQCRTENQFNLLHIAYEHILAPIEFIHFTNLVKSQQLPEPTYDWLRRIAKLSPELFTSPKSFRRQARADNVLLYQDPARDASGKSLLVGFAGNSRRLMMPIAIFLQCLDSHVWDIVLLRKGAEQETYFEGVAGVASSLSTLVAYVEGMLPTKRYRQIVTYGTSGGGLAAILAAILMNAARGISVGGAPPKTAFDASLQTELAVRRACQAQVPELIYIFGADCEFDRNSAHTLQRLFGGKLHPLAGVDHHNPFRTMLKTGHLSAYLNELLA